MRDIRWSEILYPTWELYYQRTVIQNVWQDAKRAASPPIGYARIRVQPLVVEDLAWLKNGSQQNLSAEAPSVCHCCDGHPCGDQEVTKMNMPGFTAETSLGTMSATYYTSFAMLAGAASINRSVVASLEDAATLNCGPCLELKYPNGKGTGVCYKYCCNSSGCELKDCTCPTKKPRGPTT